MKPYLYATLLQLALCASASAQFSVGYGVGYFPSGLKQVYNCVSNFNNNPDLDFAYGPLHKEGTLLPFYHGIRAGWSTPLRKDGSLRFNVDFQNLHNKATSVRVNWLNNHLYHRMNSSLNSVFLGVQSPIKSNNKFVSEVLSSWVVRGYAANYRLQYSIGEGESFRKTWTNKFSMFDYGMDFGIYFQGNSRIRFLAHYSHSLMQYAAVKKNNGTTTENTYYPKSFVPRTSNFCLQMQIFLGKCDCIPPGVEEETESISVASTN